MDHLGDHRQRADRAGADAGDEQQLREILRPGLGRGRERAVQPAQDDVVGADVMMVGKRQMGQQGLGRPAAAAPRSHRRRFPRQPVRPELGEQLELGPARGFGAAVGEVERSSPCRRPSIAACGESTKLVSPSDSQ